MTTETPSLTTTAEPRLRDRVAVVTGASTGIGAAAARLLAAQGAAVVVAARRTEQLSDLVAAIERDGGRAAAQTTDVTDPESVAAMVTTAVETFGHLDYAVNCAGVPGRGPFVDGPLDTFRRAMDVNYWGVLHAMRAEIPALRESDHGAIVNVASVGGLVGVPNLSAYTASKHAVVGLSKSVALEYATSGPRVNVLAPGGTETEMINSGTPEQKQMLASYAAMKRLSDPSEQAAAIMFLLADATFSTGIVLSTDGGQTA